MGVRREEEALRKCSVVSPTAEVVTYGGTVKDSKIVARVVQQAADGGTHAEAIEGEEVEGAVGRCDASGVRAYTGCG